MSQNKTFKTTPIPHRTKFGEPMAYYTLSDDGKIHTEVSRAVCLARIEEANNPFPQRWYVDEESGLVVRLPRNQMGEDLARDNMRFIWREAKYQERRFACLLRGTEKCKGWKTAEDGSRECDSCQRRFKSRTVELDAPFQCQDSGNSDNTETRYEPTDPNNLESVMEEKALLDTLHAALAALTQGDRDLINDRVILEKTVRELAPKYGFKSSRSITVHERRILDILRNDEGLKMFFE